MLSELEQARSAFVSDDLGVKTNNDYSAQSRQELIEEVVARRRIVESANGWERTRRVSLTCRRVDKVVKGFKIG